jgi:FkbM family methyltransferase
MDFHRSFEKVVNKLLSPLEMQINTTSRINSEAMGNYLARLADNARLIGSNGACEAFVSYASRSLAMHEQEVEEFMKFYANSFRLSRSQWGQDIFVMYSTHMKKKGIYLEVGGADGITHSNTLALRDHLGWSGLLVEPDPEMFKILKSARGHSDEVIQAAISPDGKAGTALLRSVGQLSSLVGYEGDDIHSETRMKQTSTVKTPTISLTDLLTGRPRIDYFSLDVEGAELDIIETIDWDKIDAPLVITVEHNYKEGAEAKLRRSLEKVGYVEMLKAHSWLRRGDLWMQHKSISSDK